MLSPSISLSSEKTKFCPENKELEVKIYRTLKPDFYHLFAKANIYVRLNV